MLDGKPLGSRSESPLTPDEGDSPYNYKRPRPQHPSAPQDAQAASLSHIKYSNTA